MWRSRVITGINFKGAWRKHEENEKMQDGGAEVEISENRAEWSHISFKTDATRECWWTSNSELCVLFDGHGGEARRIGQGGGRTWRTCFFYIANLIIVSKERSHIDIVLQIEVNLKKKKSWVFLRNYLEREHGELINHEH